VALSLLPLPSSTRRHLSSVGAGAGGSRREGNAGTGNFGGLGEGDDDNDSVLITSTKSATVRRIRELLLKRKKRSENRETVAEGWRIVRDLFAGGATRPLIRQIVISEPKWGEYYKELERMKREDGRERSSFGGERQLLVPQILAATPEVLAACSDTVTNQGIVARIRIPSAEELLFSYNKNGSGKLHEFPLYVVADSVSDPGNMGTLIRSCVAVGVSQLLVLKGSCDPYNPKAVRSAMGTTFSLPIRFFDTWDDCCEYLLKRPPSPSVEDDTSVDEAEGGCGCRRIYAATMLLDDDFGGDQSSRIHPPRTLSQSHYDVDWTGEAPTAIVIGSEGDGLTDPVRRSLSSSVGANDDDDDKAAVVRAVHVPMESQSVESLNASVCASVILFEYYRQKLLAVREEQQPADRDTTSACEENSDKR